MNRICLLVPAFALAVGCGDPDGGMGTKDWPSGGRDTDEVETGEGDTSDTTDSTTETGGEDTGVDTDTDSDTLLAEACGMNLAPILREEWGASILTQNSSAGYDWTNAEEVAEGIASGYYPPFAAFPDTSVYPTAYNDATWYLNNWYSWEWCCSALDWPAEYHTPTRLVIHYSADHISEGQTCEGRTVSHYDYHTFGYGHGWGDYGYQFSVCQDEDGTYIFEGRFSGSTDPSRDPFSSGFVIGAHVSGANTGSTAVMYVDDASVTITDAGFAFYLASVSRVFWEMGLTDVSVIVGHRDLGSTECPGDELYARLGEIRAHVQTCMDYYGPKPVAPPMGFASLPLGAVSTREFAGDNH